MRALARAKLNLHLCILAREASGFHQLETLFCRLELADELEMEAGGSGVRLELEGPDLGPPEQNLALRAAEAFLARARIETGAFIRLVKRIPAAAGLGGGSSDAAAVLLALNRLHGQPLRLDDLMNLGARLGSDVPFFLADTALALAWGRGERLLPLEALPRMHVLLAIPPFSISTPDAFHRLAEVGLGTRGPWPRLQRLADYRAWTSLAPHASNAFEAILFPYHPLLPDLKRALREAGAFLALMTGSGSTIFGLFRSAAALRHAQDRLRQAFPDVGFIESATDHGARQDLLG